MNRRRALWFGLLALVFFLLVLPAAVRVLAGRPVLAGSESYGHLRIANQISQDGIPVVDSAIPERAYSMNAFDFVLAGFVLVFGEVLGALFLPFLLGLGTVWCLGLALRRWKIDRLTVFCIMLVFVISPVFVNVFVQATPRALELFLFSVIFLVLSPSKRSSRIAIAASVLVALLAAIVLSSFGVIQALIVVVLPLLVRTAGSRGSRLFLFASVAAFVVLVAVSLPAFLQAESPLFSRQVPVVFAISDFGSTTGLSVFAWLLAGVGLVRCWRWKARYFVSLVASMVLLVAALFVPAAIVSAHVVASFLAGRALSFFITRKWSFDDIRTMTLLVLVCGLLFSTLSHGLILAKGGPTNEIRDAAIAVRDAVPASARLLAHPQDGFWLAYWSGKQVLLDGWLAQTPQVNERWAMAQAVWHSDDVMKLRPVLLKNRIGGIVLTREMREGLVWDFPDEGVLELVQNSETFKNVHRSSSVEVWAVLPAG